MKRKNYQAPRIKTHQVALVKMVCQSRTINKVVSGDAGLNYDGPGNGDARSRGMDSFDEWDEE